MPKVQINGIKTFIGETQILGCCQNAVSFMLTCFRANVWCSDCNRHWGIGICRSVCLRHPVMLQVRLCIVSSALVIALDVCPVNMVNRKD